MVDELSREEQERRDLDGCVACAQWDRDEEGRLMCCCEGERYLEFHPWYRRSESEGHNAPD